MAPRDLPRARGRRRDQGGTLAIEGRQRPVHDVADHRVRNARRPRDRIAMDADSLLAFVRYHPWANDRILTVAAQLTDEDLRKKDVLDLGSAFDVLRHLVDVDWSWREYCAGNDVAIRTSGTRGMRSTTSTRSTRSRWRKTCACASSSDRSTKQRSTNRGEPTRSSSGRGGW